MTAGAFEAFGMGGLSQHQLMNRQGDMQQRLFLVSCGNAPPSAYVPEVKTFHKELRAEIEQWLGLP